MSRQDPAAFDYGVARTEQTREEVIHSVAWSDAETISWGRSPFRTSFRALWSEEGLFLRFDADDTSPWNTYSQRDDPLWEEEVVEIFLDLDRSGTHYAELELNPANVVCDLHIIRGAPDVTGDIGWDFEGLVTNVEPRESNDGWTGFLFLPWDGFASLPSAKDVSLPPEPGDRWRFNVYRIERPGGPNAPREGALFYAWSPTGSPSFHVPTSFRNFVFRK